MIKIAHIRTSMPDKFGIPRQSGRVEELKGDIIFEPDYRNPDAIRGIEEYDYLWLIWEFSENVGKKASLTVRPPRLGGEEKRGVFATRSPFRPNPLGLSCVRLLSVEYGGTSGPILHVAGVDMTDKTPIYDIKPYIPYADSHPDARGGFGEEKKDYRLNVFIPEELREKLSDEENMTITALLAEDPRPAYQKDPERIYGMFFKDRNIKFKVDGDVLTVVGMEIVNHL